MLVAVEGCDGVGKSTLVEELRTALEERHLDVEVRHLGPPQRHPLEECVHDLDSYRPGSGRHVLVDRLHLGELIYGPIYRGESLLGGIDGPGHRWVDAWLRSIGGLVVHVDAELDTVLERIDVRGDDYVQTEHLDQILTEYRRAMRCSLASWRGVVCPAPEPAAQAEALLGLAHSLEGIAARSPFGDVGYVGHPDPRVVLVGDEPSPRHLRGERPTYRAPFVPYRDGCGWHLFGALTPGTLRHAAVVNQVDLDQETVDRLRSTPAAGGGSRSFIALGRVAAGRLSDLGVPHAVVPHPQHVRRFHHDRLAEYGHLIATLGWDDVTGDFIRTFKRSTT